ASPRSSAARSTSSSPSTPRRWSTRTPPTWPPTPPRARRTWRSRWPTTRRCGRTGSTPARTCGPASTWTWRSTPGGCTSSTRPAAWPSATRTPPGRAPQPWGRPPDRRRRPCAGRPAGAGPPGGARSPTAGPLTRPPPDGGAHGLPHAVGAAPARDGPARDPTRDPARDGPARARPGGGSLDRAGEDPLHEVALEGEEHRQRDDQRQERAGRQDVDVAGELPHLRLQPLGHRLRLGVGEHQRDQQVVPHPQELEDAERGDRRAAQREDHPPEDRPLRAAVHPRRLEQVPRDRGEEVAQQEDRERQPERDVEQHHAGDGPEHLPVAEPDVPVQLGDR